MKIKLVIVSDSHFDNYALFKRKLDDYLNPLLWHDNTIGVLCNYHCKDMLETYVKDKSYQKIIIPEYLGFPLLQYVSDAIIKTSDCAIIFWDGVDSDVKMLIEKCEWFESKYRVVNYVPKHVEA